jgi:hypothetical protein
MPKRLDSWLLGHAPRTGHSIKETQEASTPLWSPHDTHGQHIRWNVQMYTANLVKSSASWVIPPSSGVTDVPNPFAQSWDRKQVASPMLKLMPHNADIFKKHVNLPPNFHPHIGIASSNASIASPTMVSTLGYSQRLLWIGKTRCRRRRAILECDGA